MDTLIGELHAVVELRNTFGAVPREIVPFILPALTQLGEFTNHQLYQRAKNEWMNILRELVTYLNQTYQDPLEVQLLPEEENDLRNHVARLLEIDDLNQWDESVRELRVVV